MARIPHETIDRVRNAADILDVVSQYVDLKRRGRNYFGLCPFHHEKTPSFSVAPDKEIYHCFGCGVGGNAINFIMDYEKISFVEAIQRLGEKYGIDVQLSQDKKAKEFFTQLYDIHNLAVSHYQTNLLSDRGKKVRAYLMKERGLKEDSFKQFKIGLATDNWEAVLKLSRERKFPKDVIDKSGLFSTSDKGTFDRFRSRIMFPIFNTAGKVIAFGGRALDPKDPARYLNSPETPLYYKSDVFYGLHATREAIRKTGYVVLVEGYMDFLQLYQAGITNVVAVAGTALTERHVAQIRKFASRTVLAYDGDSAGINAALRAGYLLLQGGMETMLVKLQEGMDPDDLVRKQGPEAFKAAVDEALPLIQFHILMKDGFNLKGAARSQFIKEIITNIALISDGIIRDDLLRTTAQDLRVDERELLQQMHRVRRRRRQSISSSPESKSTSITFTTGVQKAQLELVKVLASSHLKDRQEAREQLHLDLFTEPLLKKLAEQIMPYYEDIDYAAIIDQFKSQAEREIVSKILVDETPILDAERTIKDCLITLRTFPIKEKIKAVRIKIRELEAAGKDQTAATIEHAQLQQELRSITE